jgi:hypothetical protein
MLKFCCYNFVLFEGFKYAKQSQRDALQCHLELGRLLTKLFELHNAPNASGATWARTMKEKCEMSASYSRKLRAVYELLQPYRKFWDLGISFYELSKLKPKIQSMLAVDEYQKFWSGS